MPSSALSGRVRTRSGPQSVDHPVDESLLAEAMGCQVDEDVRHRLDGIRKPEVQQHAVALNELDHAHEGRPLVPIEVGGSG